MAEGWGRSEGSVPVVVAWDEKQPRAVDLQLTERGLEELRRAETLRLLSLRGQVAGEADVVDRQGVFRRLVNIPIGPETRCLPRPLE